MTRGGDPEHRVQRLAGRLKSDATFLEHVAAEEDITVPDEVRAALATIRNWARSLGAVDPSPTSTIQVEVMSRPARPRLRDAWRRRER